LSQEIDEERAKRFDMRRKMQKYAERIASMEVSIAEKSALLAKSHNLQKGLAGVGIADINNNNHNRNVAQNSGVTLSTFGGIMKGAGFTSSSSVMNSSDASSNSGNGSPTRPSTTTPASATTPNRRKSFFFSSSK